MTSAYAGPGSHLYHSGIEPEELHVVGKDDLMKAIDAAETRLRDTADSHVRLLTAAVCRALGYAVSPNYAVAPRVPSRFDIFRKEQTRRGRERRNTR